MEKEYTKDTLSKKKNENIFFSSCTQATCREGKAVKRLLKNGRKNFPPAQPRFNPSQQSKSTFYIKFSFTYTFYFFFASSTIFFALSSLFSRLRSRLTMTRVLSTEESNSQTRARDKGKRLVCTLTSIDPTG